MVIIVSYASRANKRAFCFVKQKNIAVLKNRVNFVEKTSSKNDKITFEFHMTEVVVASCCQSKIKYMPKPHEYK